MSTFLGILGYVTIGTVIASIIYRNAVWNDEGIHRDNISDDDAWTSCLFFFLWPIAIVFLVAFAFGKIPPKRARQIRKQKAVEQLEKELLEIGDIH